MILETSSAFSPQHVHPILVNFTAALVPISVMSDIAGRALKKKSLHDAAFWALTYAAVITPLTALAGLWWKKSVAEGVPQATLQTHQWLGISLAILFIALAIWRWLIRKRNSEVNISYILFAVVIVIALVIQGSLGGEMAFG